MTEPAKPAIDLDHVAIATPTSGPRSTCSSGELGGTLIFGGNGSGSGAVQVRLGPDATTA